MPLCLLFAKVDILSWISQPFAISRTWDLSAFALSRVIMIGGLGLLLEPAGLPRGLRCPSLSDPFKDTNSLPSILVLWLLSSFVRVLGFDWGCLHFGPFRNFVVVDGGDFEIEEGGVVVEGLWSEKKMVMNENELLKGPSLFLRIFINYLFYSKDTLYYLDQVERG